MRTQQLVTVFGGKVIAQRRHAATRSNLRTAATSRTCINKSVKNIDLSFDFVSERLAIARRIFCRDGWVEDHRTARVHTRAFSCGSKQMPRTRAPQL
jgi:hypothetical protein